MNSWIKNIPKLDLHRHLTCTMTPIFLSKLLEKNDLSTKLENFAELNNKYEFATPEVFFEYHTNARSAIKDYSDFKELAKLIVSQLESDNVIYTELLFSPQFFVDKGFSLTTIFETLFPIFDRSTSNINLLIEFSRSRDQHSANRVFSETSSYLETKYGHYIKGISIGGDEVHYKAYPFKNLYQKAREIGLQTAAHAGEWVGPESIWEVINELQVKRIIHGITAINDTKLLNFLKKYNIPLDISISSNYATGAVKENSVHPIKILKEKEVPMLISTDIPGYLNISQSSEFEKLFEIGFSNQDLVKIVSNTINSSFATLEEKDTMFQILNKIHDLT